MAMMCSDIGVLLSARDRAGCGSMPAYAAFGDQKYLQPDSSAAIVVPDTGIYTVFEGETDPGYILLDGTRRVEFNYIYFISAQIQPARAADSGLRRRRTAATATWRSALSAMPRSGRCLESCSGRCSGAPTTGAAVLQLPGGPDLHGTPDGSSRGRRELSVPEQSGSPLY